LTVTSQAASPMATADAAKIKSKAECFMFVLRKKQLLKQKRSGFRQSSPLEKLVVKAITPLV